MKIYIGLYIIRNSFLQKFYLTSQNFVKTDRKPTTTHKLNLPRASTSPKRTHLGFEIAKVAISTPNPLRAVAAGFVLARRAPNASSVVTLAPAVRLESLFKSLVFQLVWSPDSQEGLLGRSGLNWAR